MCFTIHILTSRDSIEKKYRADTTALSDFQFKFFFRAFDNPEIPVISMEDPGTVQLARWGLIPHWSAHKEQAHEIRKGTYNARFESILDKPSFEIPARKSRCLVITNGFFEWQHLGKEKIPWFITGEEDSFLTMAGLTDIWKDEETGRQHTTLSIVTTAASPLMEKIHNTKRRMPLILDKRSMGEWISPDLETENWDWIHAKNLDFPLKAHTVSKNLSGKNADPNDPKTIERFDYFTNGTLF